MKAWLPLLGLIVLAGTALRLFHIGHSLRVDELETWAHAQRPAGAIISDLDRLPHVSLLAQFGTSLLGESEAALRLPFVVYGLLALPLVFLVGRELFDTEAGLLSSLLLAFSEFHIRYCQEPRYYAPFVFYSLTSFYCLLRLFRGESPAGVGRRWAYLGVFIACQLLNLSLHRLAVYPLALSGAFVLWELGRRGLRRGVPVPAWAWAAAAGTALVLLGIYIPQRQWLLDALGRESRGALTLRMSYLVWHYRDPGGSVSWELLSAFSGGGWPALFLLLGGAVGAWARGREGLRRGAPLLLWLILPLVSLALVRSRTHFELRYFIFMLPLWLVWAAAGLSALASRLAGRLSRRPGSRRWAHLALAMLLLSGSVPSLRAYYGLPKSRLREAFAAIDAECSPGDAVVVYPAWDTLWYGYYRLKDGCRLLHPSSLLEGSPAFAPEGVLGARPRVWLAGTWIGDMARAEEFARVRGLLEKACSLEKELVFSSRDPNDDYRVFSYRCRGGTGADRAAPAAPRPPRPSFWRGEGYWLLANLPQTAGRLRGAWNFSQDLALTAGREGSLSVGPRGAVLLAWEGRGELRGAGRAEGFAAGDVFFLPAGVPWRWRGAGDALMLRIDLPAAAAGEARLRRLGSTRDPGAAGEESVLARGAGWRVVLFRLEPGSAQTVTRGARPPLPRMLSVVCRGRLRIRKKHDVFHPFEGDVFLTEKLGIPRAWRVENAGAEPSVELRFIDERGAPPSLPRPMDSATGKAGGAWPPMLIP
jgi:uncharacterized membrane protein